MTDAERLPEVRLSPDEASVGDQTIAAIAQRPGMIFKRGGGLVRVVRPEKDVKYFNHSENVPRIENLPGAALRDYVTRVSTFATVSYPNGVETRTRKHPPSYLVDNIMSRDAWHGIRPLAAISEIPFIRPDGSICQQPGYDAETGVFGEFDPEAFPTVSDEPDSEEVQASLDSLMEIVADFPFKSPHHKSAWLACLLTLIAKQAIRGNYPMFVFDGNTSGCGKGLLLDTTAVLATGRRFPKCAHSLEDEEFQKRLGSALQSGYQACVIDEISSALSSGFLNSVLTNPTVAIRQMHTLTQRMVPTNIVMVAIGNNVTIRADLVRRVMPVRLESPEESPETRSGFLHGDLMAWCTAERPRLVTAALTILRAFAVQGKPQSPELTPFASFEDWNRQIRAAILHLGLADPMEGRAEIAARADTDRGFVHRLILIVLALGNQGYRSAELLAMAESGERMKKDSTNDQNDPRILLCDLFATFAPQGRALPNARQIGNKLDRLAGKVADGKRMNRLEHWNGSIWRVEAVTGTINPDRNLAEAPRPSKAPDIFADQEKLARNYSNDSEYTENADSDSE